MLALSAAWATAGNIIYTVNDPIGQGSVTGTITTDGTTGTIGSAHITDWNLLLSDGTHTFDLLGPLSGNNSADQGGGLIASATLLQFDFSSGNTFFF